MAKKRANGEGNIRKRADGRWEGRYTAGYNAETGKRIIKNVLGKTQADRYRLMIEQYTIPRIGNIKLTKLTAHDLQKFYKDLPENGRIDRKSGHGNPGLSSTTVRSLHLVLHNALNRAVKERLILRNPTEDCIAPKVQKFEMQILPPRQKLRIGIRI